LKNTNLARISVLAGFVGQNTNYQQNIGPQILASGLIVANLQFFRFNKTNGDVTAALLPVISEPGRVKFNMNATYYIKLTGNLSWNVSVYDNWDSQPPDNLSGSDYFRVIWRNDGSPHGLQFTSTIMHLPHGLSISRSSQKTAHPPQRSSGLSGYVKYL
jgi:hypothetical protein